MKYNKFDVMKTVDGMMKLKQENQKLKEKIERMDYHAMNVMRLQHKKITELKSAFDKLEKEIKENCYCATGEGTFVGMTPDDEGVCVYCNVLKLIKEAKKK